MLGFIYAYHKWGLPLPAVSTCIDMNNYMFYGDFVLSVLIGAEEALNEAMSGPVIPMVMQLKASKCKAGDLVNGQ